MNTISNLIKVALIISTAAVVLLCVIGDAANGQIYPTQRVVVTPQLKEEVVYNNPFKEGMSKEEIIYANKDAKKGLVAQRDEIMDILHEQQKSAVAEADRIRDSSPGIGYNTFARSERTKAIRIHAKATDEARANFMKGRKKLHDSYNKAAKQLEVDYKAAVAAYKAAQKKSKEEK